MWFLNSTLEIFILTFSAPYVINQPSSRPEPAYPVFVNTAYNNEMDQRFDAQIKDRPPPYPNVKRVSFQLPYPEQNSAFFPTSSNGFHIGFNSGLSDQPPNYTNGNIVFYFS